MKKIILLFILFYPLVLFSQPASGDGSSGNPYSGTITTPWTLSGDKYCGNLTVASGTFTISPGSTLRFGTGNILTISGTGVLSAAGNSSNFITFTSSGSTWGHIYFNAPSESNQSVIDYCVIENGDVHTYTDYRGYGGAIHSKFSNLIISNSILQNNYAEWGGAVFVNVGKNPTIKNCNIYNNKSDRGGGGVYCWTSSGSLIENCIFDSNQCLEASVAYYTGGGLAAQTSCSIKVLNCTFVNNTSTRTEGQSLLLHSSPNSRTINSIFWGSASKQVYCYGTTTANYIINCAYRGITYSSGTPVSPVILNTDNNASDGPNFNATDGTDWSIKFISPCRDAGTNSYTGVTIPSTDYNGDPRIGTKDIGTYEVQYSRWLTSPANNTSWTNTGNWEQGYYPGYSGTTGDVVIPPLTGSSVAPNISGTTTISSGKYLILEPGGKASFATLSNSGTLRLESDADSIASLIVSTYTDSGNEEIELYLTGGYIGDPENYEGRWHYISTPVSSLAVSTFAPGTTLDLAQFVESNPSFSLLEGWVAYDGYVYSTGYSDGPTFSTLTPGQGYNYWDDNNNTFTFSGTFNTANVPMSLGFSGSASLHGFNLLGNPFSSGLNWYDIADGVYFTYPSNTSKGLYFTRENTQCTYINGVGTPGDVTGIIPPMQGFFTKTYSTGNTIMLPAAARTHSSIHARYKGEKTIIPLVRLSVTEDTVSNDETVVRFDELAKSYLDNDFDALKMFLSSTKTTIHTSLDGTDYAINGQPFPETTVEIPVVVNVISEGNHKISAIQLQGLDEYNVTLTDNSTGFIADLKLIPELIFFSAAGLLDERFILNISNVATAIEIPLMPVNIFNIYHGYGLINIQTISEEWDGSIASVKVLDMAGKTITHVAGTEFSRNLVTQVKAPEAKGLYLVEIRSGMKRFVGKVVIK